MSIRRRLKDLEDLARLRAGNAPPDAKKALLEKLEIVGGRLRAAGTIEESPSWSPMERLAAAFERGDKARAKEIIDTYKAARKKKKMRPNEKI